MPQSQQVTGLGRTVEEQGENEAVENDMDEDADMEDDMEGMDEDDGNFVDEDD